MREAPTSVVAAVQEALQCWQESASAGLRTVAQCRVHPYVNDAFEEWTERGCSEAVTAADAAWAVAYPAALRDAASRFSRLGDDMSGSDEAYEAARWLRCWADESEAS